MFIALPLSKICFEGAETMSSEIVAVLMSAAELAEMLRISERTLWRLLSAGQIPKPVRIGRSTCWRANEIRDWIESGCQSSVRHHWK